MSIIKCIKQWAGRGSTQVSVGTIINNGTGLTSKDVQKISREEAIKVLNEVSEPARQIGANRADEFSGIVLNKLTDSDNLNSLHDPAMLAALSQAYNTAICTDNKTDYEILSELLAYRAEHPNNKNATAIVKKAIAEIDNISNDALNALTICYAVSHFTPKSPYIRKGFEEIDKIYSVLLNSIELPMNHNWVDNLEITNAIRVSNFGKIKKYAIITQENFSGYYVLGIKKKSDEYDKAIDLINANNLSQDILIDNALNKKYVRLALVSLKNINQISSIKTTTKNKKSLTKGQLNAIEKIIQLYINNGEDYEQMKKEYVKLLFSYKNIALIKDWWDKLVRLNISYEITPVGKTLAHINAKRICPGLPDIENKN